MSVQTRSKYYLDTGRLWFKLTSMKVRKIEFATEIILSLMVVAVTVQQNGNPEFAAGAIAMIHSLNLARAVEAYKEAQTQQDYQSKLD
jgi:hypothetical protein